MWAETPVEEHIVTDQNSPLTTGFQELSCLESGKKLRRVTEQLSQMSLWKRVVTAQIYDARDLQRQGLARGSVQTPLFRPPLAGAGNEIPSEFRSPTGWGGG